MLKIRLRRMGKKKQPTYRIVVAEARAPRDGAFVDIIGQYNPRTEPNTVVVDQEKARKWLQRGAQPTEAVALLLYRQGLIERPAFMGEAGQSEAAGPASAGDTAAPSSAAEAAAAPPAAEDVAADGGPAA